MNFIELVLILSWSGVVVGQCNDKSRIRLRGGTRNGEGRLEFLSSSGYWSSVCPDGWATRNAGVACEELCGERKYATSVPAKGRFGEIYPIRIFNTSCVGYEDSLVNCSHVESNGKYCYEDSAVGLCCHEDCNGQNMFLAPRLRYSAHCNWTSYTVTVQKPIGNPAFNLWPYNRPDCWDQRKDENATHNWITVNYLGDCGVSSDPSDSVFVKYSQKVLIKGQSIGPSISRLYQYLLPVTCGVSRNTNKTIWLDDSPPEGILGNENSLNGNISVDMVIKVYKDPNFSQEMTTPVQLPVGTTLYVELSVEKDKLNAGGLAKILVENCVALHDPKDTDNKHVIIGNQTAIDSGSDIIRSPVLNKVQFKMQTFKILNHKKLYLSCAGYVCPLSDASPRCNNPAAKAQHKPGASKAVDPTASSSGDSINLVTDGYEVLVPTLKRKPIFYSEDLPGLGPNDEVRIGEKDGKCYTVIFGGGFRLYRKPKDGSFATKDDEAEKQKCINQVE